MAKADKKPGPSDGKKLEPPNADDKQKEADEPDEQEAIPDPPVDKTLAKQLFVKSYNPGDGRTLEHHARQAIDAAVVFTKALNAKGAATT